jgi:hypothetical protein
VELYAHGVGYLEETCVRPARLVVPTMADMARFPAGRAPDEDQLARGLRPCPGAARDERRQAGGKTEKNFLRAK